METMTADWTQNALQAYDSQLPTVHPTIQDELELHVLRDLLVRFSEMPAETVQPLQKPMTDLVSRMTTKGLDGISRRRTFQSEQKEFYKLVVKQLNWKEAGSLVNIYRIVGPCFAVVIEVIARWFKLWDSAAIFLFPLSLFIGESFGRYLEKRLAREGRLFGEVPEA
jgi:hypothetical protein